MNVFERGIRCKSMRLFGVLLTVITGLVGMLAMSVSITRVAANTDAAGETTTNGNPNSESKRLPQAEDLSDRFRLAAQQTLPCVVEIKASSAGKAPRNADRRRPQFGAIPFEEFFEETLRWTMRPRKPALDVA